MSMSAAAGVYVKQEVTSVTSGGSASSSGVNVKQEIGAASTFKQEEPGVMKPTMASQANAENMSSRTFTPVTRAGSSKPVPVKAEIAAAHTPASADKKRIARALQGRPMQRLMDVVVKTFFVDAGTWQYCLSWLRLARRAI